MELRRLGHTDIQLSVVGQGTFEMERADRSAAVSALRKGIELGMTHIDTAEMYGGGEVERLVGEAIDGLRDDVRITSKVLPDNAGFDATIEACERSLRRLGTDRLDLYLLHWPARTPFEETFRAFEKLLGDGKVLSVGVSNFDEERLAAAVEIGGDKIACNQVCYFLQERSIEHAVIPECQTHGVSLMAYSPFGVDRFDDADPTLTAIAEKHGVTARQVGLRFLARHGFVIPKAVGLRHVQDNAGAGTLALEDDDIRRIDAAFPRGPRRRGVPTL